MPKNSLAVLTILALFILPGLQASTIPASEQDILSFGISNYPKIHESVMKSPFLRFWNSPQMADFRKPAEEWLEQQTKDLQKELGLAEKPKIEELFKGDIQYSFSKFNINIDQKKIESLEMHLAFDAGSPKNKLAEAMMNRISKSIIEDEKKDGRETRKDITFMGEKFQTFTHTPEKNVGKNDLQAPDNLQIWLGSIGSQYFIGLGNKPELEKVLSKWIPSLRQTAKVQKPMEPSLSMRLNMAPLRPLIDSGLASAQAEMEKAQAGGPQQQMGPAMFLAGLNIKNMVEALGILDFSEFNTNLQFDDTGIHGKSQFVLLQTPRGFWKLFLPTPEMAVEPVPAWVPDDAWSVLSYRLPLSGWYNVIMQYLTAHWPQGNGMVQMFLGQLKGQGLDLDKDIFQQFADSYLQVQLPVLPTGKVEKNQVHLLKIKNSTEFEQNLLKLKPFVPNFQLQPEEYMGGHIYPAPNSTNEAGCVAIAKDWFIFGESKVATQQILQLMAHPPKKPLVQSAKYVEQMKNQPTRCQSLKFQNSDAMIKGLIALLKHSPLANAYKKGPDKVTFDFSKLPDPADIKMDMGTNSDSMVTDGRIYTGQTRITYPK